MCTVKLEGFRYFAIAALLAVGIATTIATGGGGSGGGVTPSPLPTPGEATLNITATNGSDVAAAVVIAIGLSFDLGDITDQNLQAGPGSIQSGSGVTKGSVNLYKTLLPNVQQAIENCANGGTVDVSGTVANINVPTVGDHIVVVYVDCDDGLGYVMSGTVDLTIAAVQGDILTDVFLLGIDLLVTDVVVTEGASTMTMDGDFTLTLDSLDFPVIRMSMSGDELQSGIDGEIATLTNFDHAMQVDTGVFPEALVVNVLGRLDIPTLGGTVDYTTPLAVEATGDDDPHVGEILITGADDSSVRIVIIDSNNVRLDIDENGDGTVDAFVDTNWAELNGRSASPVTGSLINIDTAPILARETYNAVTGFGYLTVATGLQFMPVAPLVQLNLMEVSGAFGPLQIDCSVSGFATVSGYKALTNTFSAGDNLDVTFDLCSRPSEKLDGSMGFSIASFSETPGDAYVVSGTVVESGLLRVFGGSCFSGIGTIDTNLDYRFTSTNSISANSSASSFNVWAGGRSQQLTGASVSNEVTLGQAPALVSRESSGVLTSGDLSGSYSYQSLSPDQFYSDQDGATGPFAGELLVTASDGSSMRMVALDDFNLRLDLDFDGDSTIDDSILTTYATLGYGDWICP